MGCCQSRWSYELEHFNAPNVVVTALGLAPCQQHMSPKHHVTLSMCRMPRPASNIVYSPQKRLHRASMDTDNLLPHHPSTIQVSPAEEKGRPARQLKRLPIPPISIRASEEKDPRTT